MIVKGKYRYEYITINIQAPVAKRFRLFSKKIAKSHAEALTVIMNFFEWHGFYPSEKFERRFIDELLKNRKRTEAVIAIIKDIEKNNDKPNTAMLQLLFEGVVEKEKPVRKEKLFMNKTKEEKRIEETTVPKVVHERAQLELKEVQKKFGYVLDHVQLVNNRFGKDYLKLELSQQEFTRIKRELKRNR
jgi:hypothetical protein